MRSTRRIWWKAAGLVMAASAVTPALAQSLPGATEVMALPDDAPVRTADKLPAPRPVAATPSVRPVVVTPAAPTCGPECATDGGRSSWQSRSAERHAACQAHFWGYPEEFEAPPLGAVMHAHFRIMTANGQAAAMVLYRCDFKPGSSELNLRGRERLTLIASLLGTNNFPIIIEPAAAAAETEARRAGILNVLALNSIVVPPERVVIGPPIAYGLSGSDAERLFDYHYYNLRIQATPLPVQPSITTGGSTGTGTSTGAAPVVRAAYRASGVSSLDFGVAAFARMGAPRTLASAATQILMALTLH